MPRTGIVRHDRCIQHLTGPGHPERPERLAAIDERLEAEGLRAEVDWIEAPEAPLDALRAVHDPDFIARVERQCDEGYGILDTEDTTISRLSFEAARRASGGILEAVDRVVAGTWDRGFVMARPPGHHAERAQAMGFCLVNHVAVAAQHLRQRHGLGRVAIVDWDVHHGNGTQHTFEEDPKVFFASLHQYPHYPGTGAERERGRGDGEGATLNCPMPTGCEDAEWLAAFEGQVLPALDAFRPEFILVSAGFDAHRDDPLSGTRLSEEPYEHMTRGLLEVAGRHAGGRFVSTLEGGYNLDALGRSAATHVRALVSTPAP